MASNFYLGARQRKVMYFPEMQSNSDDQDPTATAKSGIDKWKAKGTSLATSAVTSLTGWSKISQFWTQGYEFPGVQSIEATYARDVAVVYGLQQYSMVPWYTKAINLSIQGLDYTGAFYSPSLTSNIIAKKDNTIVLDKIRKEMIALDGKLVNRGVLDKPKIKSNFLLSTVRIGELGDPDCITLHGFITSFTPKESVTQTFITNYSISFLGIDDEFYASLRGKSGASTDRRKANI